MFDFSWRTLHIYPLLAALATAHRPKNYLEIGSWKGDSIAAILDAYNGLDRVLVCDPFFGHCGGPKSPAFLEPKMRKHGFKGELQILHGLSQELLRPHLETSGEVFDLALIDGDHNYEPAWIDITTVVPRSRITLVHDLDHDTVWKAFRQYVQKHAHLDFMVTAEHQGTGVIFNPQAGTSFGKGTKAILHGAEPVVKNLPKREKKTETL